jgi:hypothetical protein
VVRPFVRAGLVPALSRATTRVAPTFAIAPRIPKEPIYLVSSDSSPLPGTGNLLLHLVDAALQVG